MSNDYKKLVRSKNNRMVCGVCAGVAEYFNLDPTVVRLLAVLAGVASAGTVMIAYLVAAVIIPEEW
ncbi:MAG: PspC domain-containing protein [Lachnospiraceae bacterium]|nr:PspC domain-containing protein [Lachnospiraceae bacterium]